MSQSQLRDVTDSAVKAVTLCSVGDRAPIDLQILPGTTVRDVFAHAGMNADGLILSTDDERILRDNDDVFSSITHGETLWVSGRMEAGRGS